jgi:L-threonylcarbamoyladenylate synthase
LKRFPSHWQLHTAARWVRAGGVITYPTEAVFGLGCDPGDRFAVERLPALKRRSATKGLILIASERNQLQPWLDRIPAAWHEKLQSSWPGQIGTLTKPTEIRDLASGTVVRY